MLRSRSRKKSDEAIPYPRPLREVVSSDHSGKTDGVKTFRFRSTAKMIHWEYKTIELSVKQGWGGSKGTMDTSQIDRQLNKHGSEGWELVAAFDTEHTAGTSAVFCMLKRPRQS